MKTLILQELKSTQNNFGRTVKNFLRGKLNCQKLGEGAFREVYLHPTKRIVFKYQNKPFKNSNLLEFQNYMNMSNLGRQFLAASYYYREFADGSSVLVSEYIEGETLWQSFRGKRMPNGVSARFVFCQAVTDTLKRFGLSCDDIHDFNIIIPSSGIGFKVVDYSD